MKKTKNFPIRIPDILLFKIKIIASYNDRSANKEIVQLIRHHIHNFERDNGQIKTTKEE